MKTLKIKLKNTKIYKRIAISFCSLLMVFASCYAPYSEVKAIVGVDDAFYAYTILTALGVLGIGLTATDQSRDAIIDLGNKAYNSIKDYAGQIGSAAVTNLTNFFTFCKDTGKMSLDKLNDIKDLIQHWFNAQIVTSYATSDILKGVGLSDYGIDTLNYTYLDIDSFKAQIPDKYSKIINNYSSASRFYGIYFLGVDALFFTYTNLGFSENYYSFSLDFNGNFGIGRFANSNPNKITEVNAFRVDSSGNEVSLNYTEKSNILKSLLSTSIINIVSTGTNFLLYNNVNNFKAMLSNNTWDILNKGTLELDPPKKVTDSFKLDDRVLGQDNTLDLTDTIVGATGSLTLDRTADTITSLGTLDIPDTAIDYPYTAGTWDNTLSGIGAIAWNPDIDVPIADTNIIAPTTTIDGEDLTDKKVGDYDGEGGQLSFDWKNVFPFCIPFDLITFIKCLCADPEAPKLDIPFNVPIVNYKGSVSIDLSKYDSIAKLCRTLMDLLFILGLAYGTRELIKG